jgi:hypothetical protein
MSLFIISVVGFIFISLVPAGVGMASWRSAAMTAPKPVAITTQHKTKNNLFMAVPLKMENYHGVYEHFTEQAKYPDQLPLTSVDFIKYLAPRMYVVEHNGKKFSPHFCPLRIDTFTHSKKLLCATTHLHDQAI